MRRAAVLIGALSLSAAGCPDDADDATGGGGAGPDPCTIGFLGDPSQPPAIEIFYFGADEGSHPIEEGAVLDLIEPPQGGRVVFVGARATNVDGCGALLTGTFRDTVSNQIRFDTRSVNLSPEGDGWGSVLVGDLAQYANIPACHNTWTDRSLYGEDFKLEVRLRDREERLASADFTITAQCTDKSQREGPAPNVLQECLCICEGGYVLGDVCEEGGGGAGGNGGNGGAGGAGGS